MNMNMKNRIYTAALLLLLACVSCTRNERIFDKSASQRTQETLDLYRTALTDRGLWVMEYFPDKQLRYGGWIYVLEFRTDLTVKAWFEGAGFIPQSDPVTESEYAVDFGTGPMLRFCTNNDYLHFFSFPGGPNGGGYQGWGGDHEFTFMSISPARDEIVLRGLKSHNRMVLRPLPENMTPERYLEEIHKSVLLTGRTEFDLCVNGKVIGTATRASAPVLDNFSKYYGSKVWTLRYNDGDDIVRGQLCSINLPDGEMRLYEPYAFRGNAVEGIDGRTVGTFRWTPGVFTSLDYYSGTDSFYQITLQ